MDIRELLETQHSKASTMQIVSLPRLRGLMLHENEVDAHTTVEILVRELDAWTVLPENEGVLPDLEGSLVIHRLAAGITDQPIPLESLKATTVWTCGL